MVELAKSMLTAVGSSAFEFEAEMALELPGTQAQLGSDVFIGQTDGGEFVDPGLIGRIWNVRRARHGFTDRPCRAR